MSSNIKKPCPFHGSFMSYFEHGNTGNQKIFIFKHNFVRLSMTLYFLNSKISPFSAIMSLSCPLIRVVSITISMLYDSCLAKSGHKNSVFSCFSCLKVRYFNVLRCLSRLFATVTCGDSYELFFLSNRICRCFLYQQSNPPWLIFGNHIFCLL